MQLAHISLWWGMYIIIVTATGRTYNRFSAVESGRMFCFHVNLSIVHNHLHGAASKKYSYKAGCEVQHERLQNNNLVVHCATKDGVLLWPHIQKLDCC